MMEKSNVENGNITHVNQKTGKTTVVPVHPEIKDIIEKYNGKLPKQYNDVLVNVMVKQIAYRAGIKGTIRYSKTEGGVKKEFVAQKWELVTNHTARRSLTTNLLRHADAISVMPVTGMSLKTLQLYNKRTADENAEMLKENPFFKRKN